MQTRKIPADELVRLQATTVEDGRAFVERLVRREPEAMAEFFDRYFKRVFGFVRRQVLDEHLAEDLTQDVFANLHRSLERLDPERPLEPWVFAVTANRLRDHWRSRAHRAAREEVPTEIEEEEGLHPIESARPDDELQRIELATRVRAAVELLPETMREAVLLRDFAGLTFRDIGERVKRNEAAARKRHSRALEKLREILSGPGFTGVEDALSSVAAGAA